MTLHAERLEGLLQNLWSANWFSECRLERFRCAKRWVRLQSTFFGVGLLWSLFFVGAAQAADAAVQATPRVVASIPPLALIAQEIVGGAEVPTLLPPGGNPHSFEPKPSDAKRVQGADVLLVIGLGFDDWALRLPAAPGGKKLHTVLASRGLDLLPLEAGHAPHGAAHDETDRHQEELDPHFWMDPVCAAQIADTLALALVEIDPTQAAVYRTRAEKFRARLLALDQELLAKLKPLQGTGFVATHGGWAYFARHFGLVQAVVLQEGANQEPGPRTLKKTIDAVRTQKLRAVFSDARFLETSARIIAQETGIPIVRLDLHGASSNAEDYDTLLRWNVEQLIAALH